MTLEVRDVMSRDAVALREATPFERIVWTLKHYGTPAVTVDETTSVREAARLMHRAKVRQLPVVDSVTGRLHGMLTRSAVLRAFTRSGAVIAAEIRQQVLGQDAAGFEVSMLPGRVVMLRGSVSRSSQVDALVAAVKRVEGVAAVHAFIEVLDDES